MKKCMKRVVTLFLVSLLFIIISPKPVSADLTTDLNGMNAGDVLTYKKAEKVRINEWKVTLDVYGKEVVTQNKASVVLVIDVSGSMNDVINGQTKIAKAKATAISFANNLLTNTHGNIDIAVVTFNQSGHNIGSGFTNNLATITSNINSISTPSGGTNIQAGIYQARQVFLTSDAISQYMVVMSDGEPTYAQSFTSKSNAVTAHRNGSADLFDLRTEVACGSNNSSNCKKYETNNHLPYLNPGNTNTLFNYSNSAVIGNGSNSNNIDMNERRGTQPDFADYEYNLANNTISEAAYFKNNVDNRTHPNGNVDSNIYTVGIQASSNLTDVLKKVASNPSMAFTPDLANLQDIFDDIAANIKAAVNNGVVDVQMSPGFNIVTDGFGASQTTSQTQGTVTLTHDNKNVSWQLGPRLLEDVPGHSDIKHAQLSYIVEINENILTQSSNVDGYQLAPNANLSYKTADGFDSVMPFQQIRLKPLFVDVKETFYNTSNHLVSFPTGVKDEAGLLTGSGFNKTFVYENGKESKIFYEMKNPGNYGITENMIQGNSSLYTREIFINGVLVNNINLDLLMDGTVNAEIRFTEIEQHVDDGAITVTKDIEYTNGAIAEPTDSTDIFNIKVCTDAACNNVVTTASLKDGESSIIGSLADGDYYIIEDNPGRFITSTKENNVVLSDKKVTIDSTHRSYSVVVENLDDIPPTIEKIDVKVDKVWKSIENRRHPLTTLKLQRDGVDFGDSCIVGDVVGLDVTQSHCNWTGLNKTDGSGTAYVYTVVESDNTEYSETEAKVVDGAGNITYTFTNTYTAYQDDVVSVKITKDWLGIPDGYAVSSAHFILKNNGQLVPNSQIELVYSKTQPNEYTWVNLPKYTDYGSGYVLNNYSVEETNPLFEFDIVYETVQLNDTTYSAVVHNTLRAPEIKYKDMVATKQWQGGPVTKPNVTFRLLRDNKVIPNVSDCVLKNAQTKCEWKRQPLTDSTTLKNYEYKVVEINVPKDYKASYSSDTFIVTNKYTADDNDGGNDGGNDDGGKDGNLPITGSDDLMGIISSIMFLLVVTGFYFKKRISI